MPTYTVISTGGAPVTAVPGDHARNVRGDHDTHVATVCAGDALAAMVAVLDAARTMGGWPRIPDIEENLVHPETTWTVVLVGEHPVAAIPGRHEVTVCPSDWRYSAVSVGEYEASDSAVALRDAEDHALRMLAEVD